MKIFMVTSGHYSDYEVNGVYSTREKAAYAKVLFYTTNDIVELELDATPEHPECHILHFVRMDRYGDVKECHVCPCTEENNLFFEVYGDEDSAAENQTVCCRVWAIDEEHAIKITNERRAQAIASGQFEKDVKEWMDRQTAHTRYKFKIPSSQNSEGWAKALIVAEPKVTPLSESP